MANKNNSANVAIVGPKVGGAVYVAPLGTTLPTDATSALDAAFGCVGYVNEEGMKESISRTVQKVKEWGGSTVASVQTEYSESYKAVFLEMNREVLALRYGADNITAGEDGKVTAIRHNAKMLEPMVMVTDMVDVNGGRIIRKVAPMAQVTGVDEITYKPGAAAAFGFTIDALAGGFPNDDDCVKEYIAEVAD